ncbi:tetratricopeptide repeat protein, partial [Patulibacter sp.]|uniref:tetratricopeptide repeat protein n=1 Tax=Patulibacter sp. TaxID=1912859 RepID=UPI002727932A
RGRDAVAAARRAAELAPESAFAHRTVARACLALRLLPDAQAAVDQAIRLEPENADGHVLRGTLLLERSRPVEAEAAFREALRLEPHDAGALNDLGVALQRQGTDRGPEAREAFEAAARARPGDALARENLAAEARSWVNGRWAWGLVVFSSVKAAFGFFGDATDRTAAVAWLVVALGLAGWLLVRGRQRRALLSPATQRLLQDQGWRERTQVLSYRPWFWFVPAPIWLAVALVVALVCVVDAVDGGGGGTWAVLAASLVVAGLTGRRTWRRWGIPWWSGRRG